MSAILALDLGGTHLRAGLADADQTAAVEAVGCWPAPADLATFTQNVAEIVDRHAPIARVGLAVPGLTERTRCRWIPNLPWLDGVDLVDLGLGALLALGNDSQFSLLAEATHGAAVGLTDAILLSIGTGVGSAVLAGGRIVRGGQGGACSFGWACADMEDRGDANDGWLERKAAGRFLDTLARKTIGVKDASTLVAAARSGDKRAAAMLDEPARAIGVALAGAVALLDPQAILVTGGVAEALDVLEAPLLAALRRQLPPHLKRISVKQGSFGRRASLVGAAVAARAGANWANIR